MINSVNLNSIVNKVRDRVEQYRGSDIERKVKEATSSENWGVSGTIKEEIAQATFDYSRYAEVMPIVWRRMGESGKNWKMVFKALDLLDYLLKRGSERVVSEARERQYQIRTLRDFHFSDLNGQDRGSGIREKSRSICEMLNSDEMLQQERKTAKALQGKFIGMGAYGATRGITGGGYGASGGFYDQDSRFAENHNEDGARTTESFERAHQSSSHKEDKHKHHKKHKHKKKGKKQGHDDMESGDISYGVGHTDDDTAFGFGDEDESKSDTAQHRQKKKHGKKKSKDDYTSDSKKKKKKPKKKKKSHDAKEIDASSTAPPHRVEEVPDLLGGPALTPSIPAANEPFDMFGSASAEASPAAPPTALSAAEDDWGFASDFVAASPSHNASTTDAFAVSELGIGAPAIAPDNGGLLDFATFSASSPLASPPPPQQQHHELPAQPSRASNDAVLFDDFISSVATQPPQHQRLSQEYHASVQKQKSSVKVSKPVDACWDSNLVDLGNLSLESSSQQQQNAALPHVGFSNRPMGMPSLQNQPAPNAYGFPQQQQPMMMGGFDSPSAPSMYGMPQQQQQPHHLQQQQQQQQQPQFTQQYGMPFSPVEQQRPMRQDSNPYLL